MEAYLDRCVESIVNQTYTNLEIILVDDGSPDNCPAMCDAWAEKDSRILVIHKANEGVSAARNDGLKIARGKYIAFVDSDDWVEKEYVQVLVSEQIRTNAQIVACDYRLIGEEWPGNVLNVVENVQHQTFSTEEALNELIENRTFRSVVWNKLYLASLLEGESFPRGKIHEDEVFSYVTMGKAKKLAYTDMALYNYVQRAGSIMHVNSLHRLDALDALLQRLNYLEPLYPELYRKSKVYFCIECAVAYNNAKYIPVEDADIYKRRVKAFRKQIKFLPGEFQCYNLKQLCYIFGSKYGIALLGLLLHLRSNSVKRSS